MAQTNKTIVVAGASRGIGLAVARHREGMGDRVYSVSRGRSEVGTWVEADLATAEGCLRVAQAIGEQPVDALLFLGGTWEKDAFTSRYKFGDCSDEDLVRVLEVNLLAPIRLVQRLLPALQRAEAANVVLMGALSGLPHRATAEVANTASKFGLQGVAQALAKATKGMRIRTTMVNPGNVATPEVMAAVAAGDLSGEVIPMEDLVQCIDMILRLSGKTVIERIDLAGAR